MQQNNLPNLANTGGEQGAGLIEYTVLVALIAIVTIVSVRNLGFATEQKFTEIKNQVGGGDIYE